MGMFKTTDEQHWEHINNGLWPQTQIFRIAINPNNSQNIFIAESHGLYRTDNGGASWYKVLPTNPTLDRSCTDVCFSPDGSKLYAIGPSSNFFAPPFSGIGFWKSENDQAFVEITPGSGYPHAGAPAQGRSLLAVSAAEENLIYVLSYDDGPTNNYVYKSINAGAIFTVTNGGNSIYTTGANTAFNMLIRCSDVNPDVCFAGWQDLYRTTDGGQNWFYKAGYGSTVHPDFHTLDFNPNPNYFNKITTGSDGGVYRSDNLGDSWLNMNQNLGLAQMFRVASNTYNTNVIVGGIEDEGIGYKDPETSRTYWKTTQNAYFCDGGLVLASPFKSNYFVGGLAACRYLYYSTDGGLSFPGASGYYGGSAWIAPTVNHPTQPGVLYTMRHGTSFPYYSPYILFKSTNYGSSWFVEEEFENTVDYNQSPQALAISASNPNLIIFANGNGSDFWHRPNELYKLMNDGNGNWSKTLILTGGQYPVADRYFTHIEIDPKNENEIYLTVSGYGTGHVFRSMNGGVNWSDLTPPNTLPDNPTNDLIIHYTSSTTKELIVSCDVGVFRTDAQNISWQLVASSLPNAPAMDLDLNRLSGILRTPTFGRGVWEVQLDGTTYVQDVLYITDHYCPIKIYRIDVTII